MMRAVHSKENDPQSLAEAAKEAASVLEKGGVIVYPTDTAYGLGANALREDAIEKIFHIKHRARTKPLSISVRDAAMADRFAVVSPLAKKFLEQVWPGPVTIILPKRSALPDILTNGGPIGLRCPDHPLHRALFGIINFPITATSANISGEESVYDIKTLKAQFKTLRTCVIASSEFSEGRGNLFPDLFIDAGKLENKLTSTVIDLTTTKPHVLRIGPVSAEQLQNIFSSFNSP